jgi:SOS response regulatory protein OraA/RecX
MNDGDPLEIAAAALRHRDRSRREVEERLARAGVDADERDDALETLERLGYLDDTRFAAGRAEALAARGFGDEAIRHDLAEHGVAAEAVEAALGALAPESPRAQELVERLGATAKTAAALTRKGFAPESLEAALGGEFAAPDV